MFLKPALHSSIILLFACSLYLSACSDSGSDRSARKPPEHLVESVFTSYQNISVKRTIPGTLQAIREVRIINQVQGLLTDLPVYPGDEVTKGQMLAQLDDSLTKAEVQKAQATLKQTKVDLKRLQDLAPRKMASESEVAKAQTLKDIAASELHLRQTEFQHSKIKAPFNGIISERLSEPGDVIPLHTHLLTLIDTSSLKVEVHLSELLLPLIESGNKVDISIDALGDKIFSGKIKRIYPSIDETTRRGTIEVVLNPVPEGARAGQLSRVSIHTPKIKRLMIPYEAVRHDKQGAYVYTLNNGRAERVNISTGIQQDQLVEVLIGLTDQQEIINRGFFGLKDGKKVRKVELKTPDKNSVSDPVQNL